MWCFVKKKKEIQRGALTRTKALLVRRSRRSLLNFAACQSKTNSFLKAAMAIFTFELTKKIEVLSEWPTRVIHLHDVYGDRQAELLKRTAIEGGDLRAARILDSSSQRAAVSRCEEVKKPRKNCSISAETQSRAGRSPPPACRRRAGFPRGNLRSWSPSSEGWTDSPGSECVSKRAVHLEHLTHTWAPSKFQQGGRWTVFKT